MLRHSHLKECDKWEKRKEIDKKKWNKFEKVTKTVWKKKRKKKEKEERKEKEREDRNINDDNWGQHWCYLHIVILWWLLSCNLVDLEDYQFELEI